MHTLSIHDWLERKPLRADLAAIALLSLLWAFYFWRVLTPNQADQVSLPQGDYSGQFLAFGSYQADRLLDGEIPLWNPYNRGGHPFLADTQAAVFYPIRLLTILISHLVGSGWNYAALQAETIAHYWLASLFMFLFARTVTRSRIAGIVSAIIFTYGGYLTGYPPLQLAILEAAVWLPLILLGIHQATEKSESPSRFAWLVLSASALGIGLLAGHPQTSLYSSYLSIAYLIYRSVTNKASLFWLFGALFIVVGLGFGIAAIQLLPGLEYTRLTTRAGYGFEQLASGFPFSDLIGAVLPKVLSLWSPLYSGILALILAAVAVKSRAQTARFWAVIVAVALGLSLGKNTIVYAITYLAVPGFSLFRGQERAAFIISLSVALLAGLGASALISGRTTHLTGLPRRVGQAALAACGFAAVLFIVERSIPREETYAALRAAMFLAVICTLSWGLMMRSRLASQPSWRAAMLALIFFDLFSVTMGTNWQPVPASQRDLLSDLVPPVISDASLFRVDGRLGLGENYGSMTGIQDIRGTSPLWLAALEDYYHLPEARLYQLLSVKYVFTDWQQLTIPTSVIAETQDGNLPLYLHKIENSAPRAWMVYSIMDTSDRAQALGWLANPSFDPLRTVILQHQPDISLPALPPAAYTVSITNYEPERIEIQVDTPADGVLVISELDYPGWVASVDGQTAPILEANAGIRAVALHRGMHKVVLEYRPMSFVIGTVITLLSTAILAAIATFSLLRRKPFTGSD